MGLFVHSHQVRDVSLRVVGRDPSYGAQSSGTHVKLSGCAFE